jgi:uncharacterized NAD(P)/FAD-binding protein YdhS
MKSAIHQEPCPIVLQSQGMFSEHPGALTKEGLLERPFTFAIVGGGLTATSMLCQFVEKASAWIKAGKLDPRLINLSLFEKTDEFGPGFPHNHRYLMHFHITNMCAADMGVYADRPGDFQLWVDRNLDRLKVRYDGFPEDVFASASGHDPCKHYPRAFMGAYLHARFNQASKAARTLGMAVNLYPGHEVTDVRQVGDMVRLVVQRHPAGGCPEMLADAVLLATGHWFPDNSQKTYFDSPWPAKKLLEDIPPEAEIAIIGTSLSAIETVLTLTSDGRFVDDSGSRLRYIPSNKPRRITLYSRSGLLPKVRGKVGARKNQFLTPSAFEKISARNDGRLTLAATFELLKSELEAIYGQPVDWLKVMKPVECPADALNQYLDLAEIGDDPQGAVRWQTMLVQTFPFIRAWYLKLTDQDRRHFDRHYTSAFFTHAATQPRINAAKLLALFNAGLVRVVRLGNPYRFYRDDDQDRYCFDYTDRSGKKRLDIYRYVVNARGQPKALTTDTSDLTRNLIASICAQRGQEPPDRAACGRQNTSIGQQDTVHDGNGYDTLRIDPQTHRVILPDFGPKSAVYAVGAMTRSQIIDASMAHGISCSTETIAGNLLALLPRRG